MSKPIISLDVDGVIAGGNYIPAWDRNPSVYSQLPLLDPLAPFVLEDATEKYNIYFISSRRFDSALEITRKWLLNNNIYLEDIAGVIVGQSPSQKIGLVEMLGCALHFDDHPGTAQALGEKGVLYVGRDDPSAWWPGTTEAMKTCRTVRDWVGVAKMLGLPVPKPEQQCLDLLNERFDLGAVGA